MLIANRLWLQTREVECRRAFTRSQSCTLHPTISIEYSYCLILTSSLSSLTEVLLPYGFKAPLHKQLNCSTVTLYSAFQNHNWHMAQAILCPLSLLAHLSLLILQFSGALEFDDPGCYDYHQQNSIGSWLFSSNSNEQKGFRAYWNLAPLSCHAFGHYTIYLNRLTSMEKPITWTIWIDCSIEE